MPDTSPVRNLIAGGITAGLGLWVWAYTAGFPDLPEGYPGPALFPRLIAAGLVLSGLALVAGSLRPLYRRRRSFGEPLPHGPGLARLALVGALLAAYPLLQCRAGFVPALGVLMLAVGWMLGVHLRLAVPAAVLGALLIYWIFAGLLGVPLA
jgi:putative tricarboxylic transport membrane protein